MRMDDASAPAVDRQVEGVAVDDDAAGGASTWMRAWAPGRPRSMAGFRRPLIAQDTNLA